ncbi:hypothetical protein [Neobacillus terrae]|uniref:hypothetical protein n=1 Tax=Neobacillus terrae TaxID=3034837 RepID=UPI00140CCBBE|nr:hypothetical protein [Neobacillus terrae]NHM31550.1 hypothetical protein [Neobacillus terrae]
MNSETYIDFCFITKLEGNFTGEIDDILKALFKGNRLNWYLEEKSADGAKVVIAEIKGMSNWNTEEEAIMYIEDHAGEAFWNYLQGYKMFIYPNSRGCNSCGTH